MTKHKHITGVLLVIFLLFILGTSGCTLGQKAIVVGPGPTCQDVLSTGLHGFSDYEVARLLDRGLKNDLKSECWIPIIKICLDENREIPRVHLAEAVKTFNRRRYENLFHKSVYRYLADAAKGKAQYRDEDHFLLESYCSFLINSANNINDKNLGQAQVLCRKLDPDLYSKFFR